MTEQNINFVGTTDLGKTNIHGDIDIDNQNTNINSSQLKIKDNIITLNFGEEANKVSSGIAGIEIDRGANSKFMMIFDETDGFFKIGFEDKNLDIVLTRTHAEELLNIKAGEILDANY